MAMERVFGNEKAKAAILGSIRVNRLPQAMILEGDAGSGKETFAREICAAAMCNSSEKPCGDCRSCRRILDRITPDVVTVARDEKKTVIGVDAVREMSDAARNGPAELPMLFFIVKEADKLTEQAQNAWLLTLENPPEDVGFILLCENAKALLETIRSRAPIFRMERFEPEEIVKLIRENPSRFGVFPNEKELFEAAVASGGSIGKTLLLSGKGESAHLHETREAALSAVKAAVNPRMAKADKIREAMRFPDNSDGMKASEARESFKERLSMMADIYSDLIMLRCEENVRMKFFTPDKREEAIELSELSGLSTMLSQRESCMEAINSLSLNASIKGIRIDLAMRLGLI